MVIICKNCKFYRKVLHGYMDVCISHGAPITDYQSGTKSARAINIDGKCPYYQKKDTDESGYGISSIKSDADGIVVHDFNRANREDFSEIAKNILSDWALKGGKEREEKIYVDVMGAGGLVYTYLRERNLPVVSVRRKVL